MIGLLVILGVIGAAIDIILHILQLTKVYEASTRFAGWLTLASCILVGVSLIGHFNLGAFLIEFFVGLLSIYAIVTGKEAH